MARNQEALNDLRRAFIQDRLDLKTAALQVGVPYPTACRWKKKAKVDGDCWETARSASRMANGGLGDLANQVLEDFTIQYQVIMTQIKELEDVGPQQKTDMLTKLADSYVKITKAAGGGDNKIGRLAVALELLELQAKFIQEHFPDDLNKFVNILEPFSHEVNKLYG